MKDMVPSKTKLLDSYSVWSKAVESHLQTPAVELQPRGQAQWWRWH